MGGLVEVHCRWVDDMRLAKDSMTGYVPGLSASFDTTGVEVIAMRPFLLSCALPLTPCCAG
jgi:hypothetical protein